MNGTWINWRQALDWELAVIEDAREQARQRDTEQPAGVLAGGDGTFRPSAMASDLAIIGGRL